MDSPTNLTLDDLEKGDSAPPHRTFGLSARSQWATSLELPPPVLPPLEDFNDWMEDGLPFDGEWNAPPEGDSSALEVPVPRRVYSGPTEASDDVLPPPTKRQHQLSQYSTSAPPLETSMPPQWPAPTRDFRDWALTRNTAQQRPGQATWGASYGIPPPIQRTMSMSSIPLSPVRRPLVASGFPPVMGSPGTVRTALSGEATPSPFFPPTPASSGPQTPEVRRRKKNERERRRRQNLSERFDELASLVQDEADPLPEDRTGLLRAASECIRRQREALAWLARSHPASLSGMPPEVRDTVKSVISEVESAAHAAVERVRGPGRAE